MILLYIGTEGGIKGSLKRSCFTVVDAAITDEGEVPMEPAARECGMLIRGENQATVDAVAATLIGIDLRKIPLVSNAFNVSALPITGFSSDEIEVVSVGPGLEGFRAGKPFESFCFKAPSGWAAHAELPRLGCVRAGVW